MKMCCNCSINPVKTQKSLYCSDLCRKESFSKKRRGVFEGDLFYTKEGYKIEIIEVSGAKIKVKFHDPIPHEKFASIKEIKRGVVQTPYHRSVRGVGYIGSGPHCPTDKESNTHIAHKIWSDMLTRAYTDIKGGAYRDVTVCEEWHNFQNFAEWCKSQIFFGEVGYELDKDIVRRGNRVYCPEFCRFVPGELNRLLINRSNARGRYKLGVHKNSRNLNKCFTACISKDGVRHHLGNFYTEDEAFTAYKIEKERHIKEKADIFKHRIDADVYESLVSWEIREDD